MAVLDPTLRLPTIDPILRGPGGSEGWGHLPSSRENVGCTQIDPVSSKRKNGKTDGQISPAPLWSVAYSWLAHHSQGVLHASLQPAQDFVHPQNQQMKSGDNHQTPASPKAKPRKHLTFVVLIGASQPHFWRWEKKGAIFVSLILRETPGQYQGCATGQVENICHVTSGRSCSDVLSGSRARGGSTRETGLYLLKITPQSALQDTSKAIR